MESRDLFLSGTPLEHAYLWALLTRLNTMGCINMAGKEIYLDCVHAWSGCIFLGNDVANANVDVTGIEENTIYYAHEDGRESSSFSVLITILS